MSLSDKIQFQECHRNDAIYAEHILEIKDVKQAVKELIEKVCDTDGQCKKKYYGYNYEKIKEIFGDKLTE